VVNFAVRKKLAFCFQLPRRTFLKMDYCESPRQASVFLYALLLGAGFVFIKSFFLDAYLN
jgi:hypothetical protein